MSNYKGTNFERMITKFLYFSAEIFTKEVINILEQNCTKKKRIENNKIFKNHRHHRYDTVVCVQQSKSQPGNIKEAS